MSNKLESPRQALRGLSFEGSNVDRPYWAINDKRLASRERMITKRLRALKRGRDAVVKVLESYDEAIRAELKRAEQCKQIRNAW